MILLPALGAFLAIKHRKAIISKGESAYNTGNKAYKAIRNINRIQVPDESSGVNQVLQFRSGKVKELQKITSKIHEIQRQMDIAKTLQDSTLLSSLQKQLSNLTISNAKTKAELASTKALRLEAGISKLTEDLQDFEYVNNSREQRLSKELVKLRGKLKSAKGSKISDIRNKISTIESDLGVISTDRSTLSKQMFRKKAQLGSIMSDEVIMKKEQFRNETDVNVRRQLASDILKQEKKVEDVTGTVFSTNSTQGSRDFSLTNIKLSASCSKKEYARFVKDYLNTKSQVTSKFSNLDHQMEKNQEDIALIKSTLSEIKYVENGSDGGFGGIGTIAKGGLLAGLILTIKKMFSKRNMTRMFRKFIIPVGKKILTRAGKMGGSPQTIVAGLALSEVGGILLEQFEDTASNANENFADSMQDVGKHDSKSAAQYDVISKFLKSTYKGEIGDLEASEIAVDIMKVTDPSNYSKVLSLAKVRTLANPEFMKGDVAGIFGFNATDKDVLSAIKSIDSSIDTNSRNDVRDFLTNVSGSMGVLNALMSKYGGFDGLVKAKFGGDRKLIDKEISFHDVAVNRSESTAAVNAIMNSASSSAGYDDMSGSAKFTTPVDSSFSMQKFHKKGEKLGDRQRHKLFDINPGVNYYQTQPELRNAFENLVKDFNNNPKYKNLRLLVTSAYRTEAKQKEIAGTSELAATGTSVHQLGLALDVVVPKLGNSRYKPAYSAGIAEIPNGREYLAKFGLWAPVVQSGVWETWHIELIYKGGKRITNIMDPEELKGSASSYEIAIKRSKEYTPSAADNTSAWETNAFAPLPTDIKVITPEDSKSNSTVKVKSKTPINVPSKKGNTIEVSTAQGNILSNSGVPITATAMGDTGTSTPGNSSGNVDVMPISTTRVSKAQKPITHNS